MCKKLIQGASHTRKVAREPRKSLLVFCRREEKRVVNQTSEAIASGKSLGLPNIFMSCDTKWRLSVSDCSSQRQGKLLRSPKRR